MQQTQGHARKKGQRSLQGEEQDLKSVKQKKISSNTIVKVSSLGQRK